MNCYEFEKRNEQEQLQLLLRRGKVIDAKLDGGVRTYFYLMSDFSVEIKYRADDRQLLSITIVPDNSFPVEAPLVVCLNFFNVPVFKLLYSWGITIVTMHKTNAWITSPIELL